MYLRSIVYLLVFAIAGCNVALADSSKAACKTAAQLSSKARGRPEALQEPPGIKQAHLLEKAIEDYQALTRTNPNLPFNVLLEEGFCFSALGRHSEAYQLYQRAQKSAPNDYSTLRALQSCCLAMGKLNESLEWARKVVDLFPNDKYVNLDMGDLLLRKGQIKEAVGPLCKAQKIFLQELTPKSRLGDTHCLW